MKEDFAFAWRHTFETNCNVCHKTRFVLVIFNHKEKCFIENKQGNQVKTCCFFSLYHSEQQPWRGFNTVPVPIIWIPRKHDQGLLNSVTWEPWSCSQRLLVAPWGTGASLGVGGSAKAQPLCTLGSRKADKETANSKCVPALKAIPVSAWKNLLVAFYAQPQLYSSICSMDMAGFVP